MAVEEEKRPAHRPLRWPGEKMVYLSLRLPERLKEKVRHISGGDMSGWVIDRITRAADVPPKPRAKKEAK